MKTISKSNFKVLRWILNLFLIISLVLPARVSASSEPSSSYSFEEALPPGPHALAEVPLNLTPLDISPGPFINYPYNTPANAAPVSAAWSADPTQNTPVATAAYDQDSPQIASDGSGGAIITWRDYRSGTNYDIYAQRLNSSGIPQPNFRSSGSKEFSKNILQL